MPDAVETINPHLHNVPMQIAAERGLPALAVWLWFIVVAARRPGAAVPAGRHRVPGRRRRSPPWSPMLAAGLFEYNFGDSEFLMLFLLLVTLPFAAARAASADAPHDAAAARRRGARAISSRASPALHVLVVGDVMLDRFIVGRVTRISPEAPVPVVRFRVASTCASAAPPTSRTTSPRSAARVSLVGVVGADDAAGARCAASWPRAGIGADGLVDDPARPTTEKVRIVTERNQQVARVDYEDDARRRRRRRAATRRARSSALGARREGAARLGLPEGHGHAAVDAQRSSRVAQARRRAAARRSQDSAPRPTTRARRSSRPTITRPKPRRTAASDPTTRRARRRATSGPARTARPCSSRAAKQGMWLSSDEAEGAVPAVAREVADVTGAGDTVVATLALALAAGATIVEAAGLANHAAGVVVGKFGPATVTRGRIDCDVLEVLEVLRVPI